MQIVSSMIWTRVAVSISYDDSNYITSIKFISPKNSLWIVQQDTWRNGYRRWFPKLLSRLEVAGSILSTGE